MVGLLDPFLVGLLGERTRDETRFVKMHVMGLSSHVVSQLTVKDSGPSLQQKRRLSISQSRRRK
jgi:hypothetical protein